MDPSLPRHPPWVQVYPSCLCIAMQSHQLCQSYQEHDLLFVKLDVHGLGNGLRTEPCLVACITRQSTALSSHLDIAQALHAGFLLQLLSHQNVVAPQRHDGELAGLRSFVCSPYEESKQASLWHFTITFASFCTAAQQNQYG